MQCVWKRTSLVYSPRYIHPKRVPYPALDQSGLWDCAGCQYLTVLLFANPHTCAKVALSVLRRILLATEKGQGIAKGACSQPEAIV